MAGVGGFEALPEETEPTYDWLLPLHRPQVLLQFALQTWQNFSNGLEATDWQQAAKYADCKLIKLEHVASHSITL